MVVVTNCTVVVTALFSPMLFVIVVASLCTKKAVFNRNMIDKPSSIIFVYRLKAGKWQSDLFVCCKSDLHTFEVVNEENGGENGVELNVNGLDFFKHFLNMCMIF